VDFSIEQSQYPLRVYRLFLHPKSLSKLWILSKEKANPSCGLALFSFGSPSGVGGNRTRVQTRKPEAFYMLIL